MNCFTFSESLLSLRATIKFTYGDSLFSTKMPSLVGDKPILVANVVLIIAIVTSCKLRANSAASNFIISTPNGFAVISNSVALIPAPDLSEMIPCCSSNNNERPRLVGSFGTAILLPSLSSSTRLIDVEYAAIG